MAEIAGHIAQPSGERLFSPFQLCLILCVFVGSALALHHPGFHSPMIYDSYVAIKNNVGIFASHSLDRILSIVPARPLFVLTLYMNYLLAGMEPYHFRLVNSLFLALAGLGLTLLAGIVLQAARTSSLVTSGHKKWVAFFLGLLFVVHPLQTLVVLYIWQREAIMACLFYFAAVSAYLAVRTGRITNVTQGCLLTSLFFFAGLVSKENVATLPIALVLAELTLLRQSFRETLSRAATIAALTAPPFVAYLLLGVSLHGSASTHPQGVIARLVSYYGESGLSPAQVLLSECRIFFSYLSMMLYPPLTGVQLLKAQVISSSLWDPPVTLAALAGVSALIAFSVASLRKAPVISFGIMFTLVTVAPESLLIPQYLFCGYRAILPMAGVLLILAAGLVALVEFLESAKISATIKRLVFAGMILPVLWLGFVTLSQARMWTPPLFWANTYSQLPAFSDNVEKQAYVDVLGNYGTLLIAEDKLHEAVSMLRKLVEIDPKSASGHNNLGQALWKCGKTREAIPFFHKSIELSPGFAGPYNNLGRALMSLGEIPEALENFRKATKLNPDMPAYHNNVGSALVRLGRFEEAIPYFYKAIQLDPGNHVIYDNAADALLNLGRAHAAIAHLRKAVELKPDYWQAYNNLGVAHARTGRLQEAVSFFRQALAIKPHDEATRSNLETALNQLGEKRGP